MNHLPRSGARSYRIPFPGLAKNPRTRQARLVFESLEAREVLTSYALMSNQWTTRSRLTWSIPSDGVFWVKTANQISKTLDAEFGKAWKTAIAEAAYAWSSVSDLDLAEVADGAFAGDYYLSPGAKAPFGDLRIGGYDFSNSQILAATYGPPPDGWSRAGDISVNLGVDWSLGSGIDFASVILHEMGHSLGLEHVDDTSQVMYPVYDGVDVNLGPGDIAGIQSLYGIRTEDSYTLAGLGLNVAKAIALPAPAAGARSTSLAGVELASAAASDFFRIDVPASFVGTSLKVTASAGGISMLSPALSLVGADGSVIRAVASPGQWGAEVSIDLGTVLAGQSFVFKVNAASPNDFAIGGYRIAADFTGGTISPPAAPAPVVVTPPVVTPTPVTPAPIPVTPTPVTPTPVVPPVTTPKPVTRTPPVRKKPVPVKAPVKKPQLVAKKPAAAKTGTLQNSLLKALLAKKG